MTLTSADFHPDILKLFDRFVHGQIGRQDFLDGAVPYLKNGVSALSVLDALSPRFSEGQQVAQDDGRIQTSTVEFPSPEGYGRVSGYLAQPAQIEAKLPVVLVVHENRGLNPHIEDIARRFAVSGFIAFAPDGLFPLGGYPGDEDKARELFPHLDQIKTRRDFIAAVAALKALPDGNAKVGVVGFCYGGGIAGFLATKVTDLGASVSFYGSQPKEGIDGIQAPLQIHLAGDDDRVNAGWPAYEVALKTSGIAYEAYIYPGTQHGFNNDTTPRYDEVAAHLAWQRTLTFLNVHLRG